MSKSRKQTPDILGQVMGDDADISNKEIKPESNKTIKLDNGETVKTASNKAEELKEKATFNLPVSTLDKIDDATLTLKRAKRGVRITKTLIVEKAVEIAVRDLEENGENSQIFQSIQ